ncbi:unnamed protein product [Ambrosiozyma monospora]|uniref:Unnamed protein product n=1 Tax=Ambrosiozyma monospora TaxID=43982 RepID=A0A9W6YM06_AMBMO|nr:unnamed protein product [Ambrosiozyma monospora]
MSRSIAAAGEFSRVFKTTRVAQLPSKLGELGLDQSGSFPTHQVIESLPSSFSRRDFGLKLRLPKKTKTRYIVVNDIDNKYGLPDFEPRSGFLWKKLRFQELGIPVTSKDSSLATSEKSTKKTNPLFPTTEVTHNTESIAQALNIERQPLDSTNFKTVVKPALKKLRKPFMKWLVKNYPERVNNIDLSREIVQFINETKLSLNDTQKTKNTIPDSYAEKLSGTAGLSYTLKGRLFQTPNGIESSRIVPGRFLHGKSTGNLFGVGGFVGTSYYSPSQVNYLKRLSNHPSRPVTVNSESSTFSRELRIPVMAKNAYLTSDKRKLELEVEPVKPYSRFGGKAATTFSRRGMSPRNSLSGNSSDDKALLSNLLGILKNANMK